MRRSPKDAIESTRKITRRGLMLGGLQAAMVTTLALRMRSLQLEQADQFRLLADGNTVKIRLIPPARGLIFDRNGIPIAENMQNYRVTITRDEAHDVPQVLADLKKLIALSDSEVEDLLRTIQRSGPSTPVIIRDRLSWDDLSKIAVNTPALPGVEPVVGLSRAYPRGEDFAHVIGYVGSVSDYDLSKLENPDPLLKEPKAQMGKSGVESKFEQELRGTAGARRVEVNSAGRIMRELGRTEAGPGENLRLTIDYRLQNYALKRLGDESAAAVVIDVRNGDIMAIASAPSFDPNLFAQGISVKDYKILLEDDHRPLADKSVQGTYPPGSTYKMVTALAALEAGLITPGEKIRCPGYHEVGGTRFHCWKRAGHGPVNLVQSLEQSCDVYYYELSQRVGIEKMSEMARRLGCGIRHDIPMSAVAEGLAPTKEWKAERFANDTSGQTKEWRIGDTVNASIGQGYVLASPLQLAVMTARIASGREVTPRLVRAIGDKDIPIEQFTELGIKPENLEAVRAGMNAVVNSAHGTAKGSRVEAAEWRMAGKTGTSQVRNISAAERARGVISNADLPWKRRDHALFVSYAPVHDPQYAIALVVEHGGGGSSVAAPLARDILLYALADGLPPLAAYPSSQRTRVKNINSTLDLVDPEQVTTTKTRA
ncbi:penicillin-binding protein 2 [Albirhodobacter sp. R86504]|uniref:penicillin-binding protein 2 n=1 Tax=Albirhodobacter sp. R86504 TaxID=3093848 RepID=UPI00366D5B5D